MFIYIFFITKLLFPYYICQTKRGVFFRTPIFFSKGGKNYVTQSKNITKWNYSS